MTYYGSKELAASFRIVRNNTIKIAEEIPEDKYDFRIAPDCRSVGQTLIHIAISVKLQQQIHFIEKRTSLKDFDFFGFFSNTIMAEEAKPRTKAEILDLLRTEGEKFATQLEACTEEFLGETVQYPEGMMPPTKSRFEMLMSSKEHEMHHRGQLMVAERLLGITPHLTRQMMERVQQMAAAAAQKS
jgi:uncharacterized damage-inducible protein DinB